MISEEFVLPQQVYNGLRQNSPRLAKLCGEVDPGTEVKSSGNTMKVILVTDLTHATRGFSVSYTSEEAAGSVGGWGDWPLGRYFVVKVLPQGKT